MTRNAVFLIRTADRKGLVAQITGFFACRDLNILSCLCNLILWLMIALRNPSNLNYLVIGAYNLFRVLQACVIWTRKYRAEQTETA